MSDPDRLTPAHLEALDAARKIEMYEAGAYSFPPPPVCTAGWDREAWIRFIDQNGRWHTDERPAEV